MTWPRTPDLRAFEVFVAIVDTGSMTAAAQRLGLTQSAVSQHVRRLELDLGTPLLDRSLRPTKPTPAARLFFERAQRALAEADAARSIVRERTAAPLPVLRLSVLACPGSTASSKPGRRSDLKAGEAALSPLKWAAA